MISITLLLSSSITYSICTHGFISKPSRTTIHCIGILVFPPILYITYKYIMWLANFELNPMILVQCTFIIIDAFIVLTLAAPMMYNMIKDWYDKVDSEYDSKTPK